MKPTENSQQAPIFVIDDDPLLRHALTLVLEDDGLRVDAYDSAEAFLAADIAASGCCAIVDMRLPGMSGLELQTRLSALNIGLPLIFLTGYGEVPNSVAAIKGGAEDYLLKPVQRDTLLSTIQNARLKGERLKQDCLRQQQAEQRLKTLTPREREVLQLAVQGAADKEIARTLTISHRTVEKHKSSLLQKTGAKKLLDLVSLAADAAMTDTIRHD